MTKHSIKLFSMAVIVACSVAACNKKPEGPVAAKVGGDVITVAEIRDAYNKIPGATPEQFELSYAKILDMMVNQKLLAQKAKKSGVKSSKEYKDAMKEAEDQLVRSIYIQKELEAKLNDVEIDNFYNELVAKMTNEHEVKASHILVETEEEAKKVISELEAGAKFADLAKKYSKDGSKDKGGDLGYFTKGDMVPEFSEAAFALNKGEYTKTPVKSQFGWHVIEVEDIRSVKVPTKEEMGDNLKNLLAQKTIADLLKTIQEESKVEKFGLDGNPVK